MSVKGINGANLEIFRLAGAQAGLAAGTPATGPGFLTALKQRLADFGSQTAAPRLSAAGRNTALFDPESAYRMMTAINAKEATYKAELSEMGDLKSYVASLQREGANLGTIGAATGNGDIQGRLQAFVDAYNGWIRRFGDELKTGGLLAGTQAATVSQRELEQSVDNPFNGAKDGLRGMKDLGLTIDPATHLASLDTARLNSALASGKVGAAGAIEEFSANFSRSAELLNSAGNFIPNRMGNLSRVIDYIDGHKESLQAEFGLGDPARPTGQVAKALASYNRVRGLAA